MKIGFLRVMSLAMLFCFVCPVRADVNLGVTLEHRQVLRHEKVVAFIDLKNANNEPVAIDNYGQYLKNDISLDIYREGRERDKLPKQADRRLVKKMLVMPDEQQRIMVELTDWYDLSRVGRYYVAPKLVWNGRAYTGSAKVLDVVEGIEIRRITRTVPGYQGRLRTFSLRYWAREGGEHLFLRVSEKGGGLVFDTVRLGRLIRFFEPQMTVGRRGKVEIIHQSGPLSYLKSTLSSDGAGLVFEDQVTMRSPEGEPVQRALITGLLNMDVGPASDEAAEAGDVTAKQKD